MTINELFLKCGKTLEIDSECKDCEFLLECKQANALLVKQLKVEIIRNTLNK